jgi:hypothetical protein
MYASGDGKWARIQNASGAMAGSEILFNEGTGTWTLSGGAVADGQFSGSLYGPDGQYLGAAWGMYHNSTEGAAGGVVAEKQQ